MPAETTTLEIPVATDAVDARTPARVEVAVDSAVADPLPQDDRASVSFDVVPRPPRRQRRWRAAAAAPSDPGTPPAATPGPGAPAKALALRIKQPRAAAHEQVRRELRGRVRSGGLRGDRDGRRVDPGRSSRLKSGRGVLAAGRSVRLRLGSTQGAAAGGPCRQGSLADDRPRPSASAGRTASGDAALRIPVRRLKG